MPVVYSNVQNVLNTFPNVQSRSNITSAHIFEFLSRGESIIDTKLAKTYALPFTNTIPVLETLSTDIGAYLLLSRRFFTQERSNSSEWVDRFKESFELLDQIANGEYPLIDASGNLVEGKHSAMQVWSNTQNYHPTMHEDDPLNQVIDSDKTEENRNDRDLGGFEQ
jgi:phage gp36-like protein